jgi:hypothetical protein
MNAPFPPPQSGAAAAIFIAGRHQLYIDGRWLDARSGKTFETFDPGSGRVIARVAEGAAADIDAAATAARTAFEGAAWRRMTARSMPPCRSAATFDPGWGREKGGEKGREVLDLYTETKAVVMAL